MHNETIVQERQAKVKKESQFSQSMKRLFKNKGAMAGLIILVFIILLAIFADVLAPYGFMDMDTPHKLEGPSPEHLFGTDNLGRDIFSRVLYGGRYSLTIGFSATLFACLVGVIIGSSAAYYGGRADDIIMRLVDIIQSMPGTLLAICVSAVLGTGLVQTIMALTLSNIAAYTRIVRGSVLSIRKMEYLDAALVDNASDFRIIVKHILPNAISPVIVQATMGTAQVILTASSLSFIGLGVPTPSPEWGALLSAGRNYIRDYAYICIFPGLAIMLTVLSLNLLGDGLRDALDPKLKR